MSTPTRLFGCGPAALGITVFFEASGRVQAAAGASNGHDAPLVADHAATRTEKRQELFRSCLSRQRSTADGCSLEKAGPKV